MGKHGLQLALTIAFALALFACRHGERAHRRAAVYVGLADISASTDVAQRCAELMATLRPLTDDTRLRRIDALLLATGDAATGEPRVLVPWTVWSPSANLFETPDDAEKERRAWLAGVDRTCRAAIRVSDVSPVYEGVRAAKAAVAARCTDLGHQGFDCTRKALAVKSDLRSTYGAFGAYLRALAKPNKHKTAAAPPRLDLDGIETSWCGLSNTTIADGLSIEVVLRAWGGVLGAAPLVDPTCERAQLATREAPP